MINFYYDCYFVCYGIKHDRNVRDTMIYNFDEIIDRKSTSAEKWAEHVIGGKNVLPLWVADMDFKCPKPVVDAMVKTAEHGIFGYNERPDSYYKAIIDWNKKRNDWKIEKDWIVFSHGVVPALSFSVETFCKPGDKVIIQSPVYHPFYRVVTNNGCQVVKNPLKEKNGYYEMDFEQLEAQLKDPRVRLFFLCNPHNPVGRVWKLEELKRLGQLCIENNVLVVSDEIHSDLIFSGHKHIPFANISEEFKDNSIILTAPSKTFNIAGLQVSNIIVPNPQLRQRLAQTIQRWNVSSTNVFGIVAATAAYEEGEEWLEQLLKYLEENADYIGTFLKEELPEVKYIKPEGTYLAWLDFRAIEKDYMKLESFLQKRARVFLNQGHIFGDEGNGFVRVNFACPKSVLEEALKRIAKAVRER
jgi:cystathionine beta-lyase